ncbi:MAG: hypothetical protein H6736_21065 [Alphaproteobacteria bacterium]|nr:hypothetical protein [Alphaproteobacteria bacterium]MCB9694309.1 hypothetical protein [Alphaproteobacteria bacterium]
MIRALIPAAVLTTLASPAMAADVYMWGVGPRLGTNFLPGAYPAAFPTIVADARQAAAPDAPVIDKVRTDVVFGFESQYYINGGSRIGAIGGFGVGKQYFDAHIIGKYDVVIQSAAVDFLVGGGAGFGTQRWKGSEQASLRVPYFPLRAEAAGMIRSDWMAYQLTVYGQYNLQGHHYYFDETGTEVPVRGGFYPTMGLELSVMFGDYEPPRPRKKGE